MNLTEVKVEWPNGEYSIVHPGSDWLSIASQAGVSIPTGCLVGSCGACEIEVNGEIIRACINTVPYAKSKAIKVDFSSDPFW